MSEIRELVVGRKFGGDSRASSEDREMREKGVARIEKLEANLFLILFFYFFVLNLVFVILFE